MDCKTRTEHLASLSDGRAGALVDNLLDGSTGP
jgi:hypothetical protein